MQERRDRRERRDTRHKPTTRRREERRDSPRTMVAYDFKVPGGEWRSTHGDLSAEGASFITSSSIIAKLIIMKIKVPAYADEIVATAVVVSQRQLEDGSSKLGLAFIDIEVDAQLAIAEWVDFKARANA